MTSTSTRQPPADPGINPGRRHLLAWGIDGLFGRAGRPWPAGLVALLAGCATDLSRFGSASVESLAERLGIGAVGFALLEAGEVKPVVHLSGSRPPSPLPSPPVFQAASLTKPVIACIALKLVREGRMDLDAPVSRHLPEGYRHVQNPFADVARRRTDDVPASVLARIPLASLLNHSSGLPNWESGPLKPAFEAGSRWRYSGEGYLLLQAVLEAASGLDIETLLARRVLEPHGLRHTRLQLTEDLEPLAVPGTTARGELRQLRRLTPNAAASLHTTAADYAAFMAGWWRDRDLLGRVMARTVTADPALGLAWGLGWGLENAVGGPYLWQWGNNPGFRAFAMLSVATGDGFVLLTNSEAGMPLAAPLARQALPVEHPVWRSGLLA